MSFVFVLESTSVSAHRKSAQFFQEQKVKPVQVILFFLHDCGDSSKQICGCE
jgi:hypothetical protein